MKRQRSQVDSHTGVVSMAKPYRHCLLLLRNGFLVQAVLFISLTLAGCAAAAQEFSLEHWTTRNGLRTSAVLSVTQTKDGNLWIGTRAGLAQFDGSQFKVFTPRNLPGLSSKYLNYVATGADSTLYIGTDDRLCVLRHGFSRSFAMQRGNRASKVLTILPGGDDEAWVGTAFGVVYHYRGGAIEELNVGFPANVAVSGLAKMPDGTLWLATDIGLFSWSHGKLDPYQPQKPLPVHAFYDLALSADGSLFAASDAGLFAMHGNQWRQWNRSSGLPSDTLNTLTTDGQGVLWIGTQKGLARLQGGTIHPVNSVSCSVQTLFVDLQKSLWIGCNDSVGLFRLRTRDFHFLSPPKAFELASASLAVDSKGTVWIGTRQGLYRYAHGRFQTYTRTDGLPSDVVRDVFAARDDVVWIATENGLATMKDGRITPLRDAAKDLSNGFFSVRKASDGTLWANSEQGLKYRLPGAPAMSLEPGFTNLVESIYVDHAGDVWIGTDLRGLHRFSGKLQKTFLTSCGIGSNTVYGSVQDDSGTMWAWTYGGLSRIRNDQCANISPDAGLPGGQAGWITYDGHGRLWLRVQDGVAAIDVAEANQVIDHPGPLTKTLFIGSQQGLDSTLNDLEITNLLVEPGTGKVWVPTVEGIARFDISSVRGPVHPTLPQITSFVSDSGEHDTYGPVRLSPGDLHLQFTYKVPSLLSEPGRRYRYRLVGFDKDWREGQENGDAIYTSIPAGAYVFEVSSRGPFEPWSSAPRPLSFTVLPHFYQTWWWYTVLACAAMMVLWFGYWARLSAARKQYAALFAERNHERFRLARELHDTLSRGMMAIHVQLQLALAFLPGKPETACTHLDHAVSIVRESASETRKSITALRSTEAEDNGSLRDALERAVAAFRSSSQVQLQVDFISDLPSPSAEVIHEVARVVQEALTNVQRHSGATQAHLSARVSQNELRIALSDNGRGFDAKVSHPEHFGIRGMQERAERIQASFMVHSLSGSGTKVTLDVPLRHGRTFRENWQKIMSHLFGLH